MSRIKLIVCILIIVIIPFIFLGCRNRETIDSSQNSSTENSIVPFNKHVESDSTGVKKVYTGIQIDEIRKEKEQSIASKLLEYYKESMLRLNKKFSYYDLTVSSIYSNMMQNFLYEDNAFDWTKDTPNANNYREKTGEKSPIYSALGLDDILFLAISQPLSEDATNYKDTVNTIRNDKNEMDFIEGLKSITNNKGYYVLDIYVEDLLRLNRDINLGGIRFTDDGSFKLEDDFINLTKSPNDIYLDNYLKKYGREVNYSTKLKAGEWNLLLFEAKDVQPYSILIEFNSFDWQMVELTSSLREGYGP